MQEREKESAIIQAGVHLITEKPVLVTIPNEPKNWYHRFWKWVRREPHEITFELKPLKVRTVFQISGLVHSIPDQRLKDLFEGRTEIEVSSLIPLFRDHAETVVGLLACALHNGKGEPPERLKELIRAEFDVPLLQRVLLVVVHQMRLSDFMTSIALVKDLNVLQAPASRD